MKKKNGLQTLPTIKKVLKYLRHYKALFAVSLILALVVVAATLYIPILVDDRHYPLNVNESLIQGKINSITDKYRNIKGRGNDNQRKYQ